MTTAPVVTQEQSQEEETRVCSRCGERKSVKLFQKHKASGYESNCKSCKILPAREKQQFELAKFRQIANTVDTILPSREENQELFARHIDPHMKALIDELVNISLYSEKDTDRLKAIQYILDRTLGKADQQITVKADGPSQAEKFMDMWNSQTKAFQDSIIDVTPTIESDDDDT